MRRGPAASRRRLLVVISVMVLALGALVASYAGASAYTSQSEFCRSCHEMAPYHDAWSDGTHADVACVSCHVDPGFAAGLAHKFVALEEVWLHVTTDPKYPLPTAPTVPDRRCLACHQGAIPTAVEGFSHEEHRGGRACVVCHSETGHSVTTTALADAGILDADNARKRVSLLATTRGVGVANVAGHRPVGCTRCHDQAKVGCVYCHARDASAHPPLASAEATTVTAASACVTCHATAASWAFSHPSTRAPCIDCHSKPAKHYPGTCTACHTPTTPFDETVFQHPSSTSRCVDCHARPSGHPDKACTTCHRTGVSWKFSHPLSMSCAACHSAPKSHYGSSCASCHSPSKAWKNATFSHPRIRGGGHSYRSFPCASCHPRGYGSASCLKCHDSNNPD